MRKNKLLFFFCFCNSRNMVLDKKFPLVTVSEFPRLEDAYVCILQQSIIIRLVSLLNRGENYELPSPLLPLPHLHHHVLPGLLPCVVSHVGVSPGQWTLGFKNICMCSSLRAPPFQKKIRNRPTPPPPFVRNHILLH